MKKAKDEAQFANAVQCPICHSTVGKKCSSVMFPHYPHNARVALATSEADNKEFAQIAVDKLRDRNRDARAEMDKDLDDNHS